ncbi:PIF1-like helicase [Medicago truncatula]|uniref:PIF1-like helicase n=1 Tax=Medicago truncatula TaxID=3880 RepID=A0A072V9T7_MEDTR|nr:PIF1-like helicase [Medicago truncatula]
MYKNCLEIVTIEQILLDGSELNCNTFFHPHSNFGVLGQQLKIVKSCAVEQLDIHTPEFLNTINSSGLPNHKITLKVGVTIMLLRNLDITVGLCNGTRLIVTKMGRYVLKGRVISGSNVGEKVYILRLSLTPSDTIIPFKFQRSQFPISLCFAMTINKSQ